MVERSERPLVSNALRKCSRFPVHHAVLTLLDPRPPDLSLVQQEVDALEELSRQLFLETVDLQTTKVRTAPLNAPPVLRDQGFAVSGFTVSFSSPGAHRVFQNIPGEIL